MIEIKNISKLFDGNKVVNDITCSIKQGSIFGIVGSNGAGKSTLLRMMTGVYDVNQGEILYDGKDLGNKLVNTEDILFLSGELHVEYAETMDMLAKRFKAHYKKFDDEKYQKLLEVYDLPKNKRISRFSKGMIKQAFLSVALACNVKYLMLDEVLDGLDPLMRINTKKILFDEAYSNKSTIIITSHSLKELEDVCDAVAMLHKGEMLVQGGIDDIKSDIVKVRCALEKEITKDDIKELDVQKFEQSGKLYTIVVRTDEANAKKVLDKFKPILLEILPITIEEVFVIKLQQTGYGNSILTGGKLNEKND